MKNLLISILLLVITGVIVFLNIPKNNEQQIVNEEVVEVTILPDPEEFEPELYDPQQIFFENMEMVFDYLTYNQVDYVKERISKYIMNIDSNILDVKILSVNKDDNLIILEVLISKETITVDIKLDENEEISEILIVTLVKKE